MVREDEYWGLRSRVHGLSGESSVEIDVMAPHTRGGYVKEEVRSHRYPVAPTSLFLGKNVRMYRSGG